MCCMQVGPPIHGLSLSGLWMKTVTGSMAHITSSCVSCALEVGCAGLMTWHGRSAKGWKGEV
jgi:hypothetical protein